ncbi:hypothetical protein GFH48_00275 [Streptomyces fagopyri]|uniref:Uncharacterized protein n=1 Tax=Streptomyces fagopyri TaxID=2662397 RepID=A0A5Q0L4G9_9ACTN|nr:hypothetical protein [Streptomyces fagopyri]QFZ71915.1 hypothetical protein GFH48_00275 [Streptomyces fagopyri]
MDLDRFKVYVSGDGLAEINGDPLVPAPGQSVHEAVLDQLHRYAEESGAAVDATVGDGPDAAHFVLRVLPDGSSHVLAYDSGETPEPEPRSASRPEPGPAFEPSADDVPPPTVTVTAVTAIATAVSRAHATATTTRTAVPEPVPDEDLLPTELAEQIGHINTLGAAGRLDEAFARATALRERLTGSLGAEHPHAVEARAMEAYLAHLRGDHRESVVLALAVARMRCGAGDERAPMDVARAAAAWQRLDDSQAAVTHGRELLHMWDMLGRRGPLPSGHAELAEEVHGYVTTLEGAHI